MSILDLTDLGLIDLLQNPRDWRSGWGTAPPIVELYAGDVLQPPNPYITLLACPQCQKRYYAQPLIEQRCPVCEIPLKRVRVWDLRREAWPWVLDR